MAGIFFILINFNTFLNSISTHQVISPLSEQFFEFIKRIGLQADRLASTFLDNAEHTRLLVNFVFTNINMLLNAVDGAPFEVGVRI